MSKKMLLELADNLQAMDITYLDFPLSIEREFIAST